MKTRVRARVPDVAMADKELVMDDDKITKLIACYVGGKSLRACSDTFGLSHEQCRHYIPADLIRYKRTGKEMEARILKVFARTRSLTETGAILGTNKFAVSRVIHRCGVPKTVRVRNRAAPVRVRNRNA